MESIGALNERYGIPGVAAIVAGGGRLPVVRVSLALATADVYLHGAQVTSWRPAGDEDVLFVSKESWFQDGKAIRGGVPICFPWFGKRADDPSAPSHGFARTRAWTLDAVEQRGGTVVVTLQTTSDATTRASWPHDFTLVHRVTIGATLEMALVMTNTGIAPLRFEEALHTYHRVGAIESLRITGLDGAAYLDNAAGGEPGLQRGDLVMTGPTDRAYLDTTAALELIDPTLRRRVRVEKRDSRSTVTWNPWFVGALALTDLGSDEWRRMVCVEAANIKSDAVELPPGGTHTMTATISVAPLSGLG